MGLQGKIILATAAVNVITMTVCASLLYGQASATLSAALPAAILDALRYDLAVTSIVLTGVATAVVAATLWLPLQTLVIKPLAVMTQAIDALGRGQFDTTIEVAGCAEVDALAAALLAARERVRGVYAHARYSDCKAIPPAPPAPIRSVPESATVLLPWRQADDNRTVVLKAA